MSAPIVTTNYYDDLIAADSGGGNLTVFPGNEDGTFRTADTPPAGGTPVALSAEDFDGDGFWELVVANAEGTVGVLSQKVADLDVTLAGPGPMAAIDSDLTYTATVTNRGDGDANDVEFADGFPATSTLASAVATLGSVDTTFTPGVVYDEIDTLPAGASATVTVVVRPTSYAGFTVTAGAYGDKIDPDNTNNNTSLFTEIVGASGSQLTLSQVSSSPGGIGAGTPGDVATLGPPAPSSWGRTCSTPSPLPITAPTPPPASPSPTRCRPVRSSSRPPRAGGRSTPPRPTRLPPRSATLPPALRLRSASPSARRGKGRSPTTRPSGRPTPPRTPSRTTTRRRLKPPPSPRCRPRRPAASPRVAAAGHLRPPLRPLPPRLPARPHAQHRRRAAHEGGGGAKEFVFTVTRSGPTDGTATVRYATADGSAEAGSDYFSDGGTLTFRPGRKTLKIRVRVKGDGSFEPDETFAVDLTGAAGATVADGHGVDTIVNDDARPVPRPAPRPKRTTLRINFQPAGAATPGGFLADVGLAFGPRGGGPSYGWNADNRAAARDRGRLKDRRLDTFNLLHNSTGATRWEVALPDGRYKVRLAAGDPSRLDGVFRVDIEGVLFLDGRPTARRHSVERTAIVTVRDGRLTLTSGPGAANNKLDFIEITPVAAAG